MIKSIFSRFLLSISFFAPFGYSLRPWLHHIRGVKIGKNVWIAKAVYLDELHPEDIEIGDTEIDLEAEIEAPPPPPKEEKKVEEEPTYFVAVEEMPEPIGGIKAIQEKIVYPEIAKRAGVEGKVYVLAFVDESGSVTKAQVLKGIGAGCDEAALDAVQKTKFKPGKQRGKPVKVQVSIPIIFKLQ